ncbi:MAG: hypothetical protein ABI167_06125 [Nitrosospira sp.]
MKKIYEVPSERRYWVVRAEGGEYYDHFTRNGIIAIGHLNLLDLPNSTEQSPSLEQSKLEKDFKALSDSDPTLKSVGKLSQAKSFLYQMKPGDWVITIGLGSVRFGWIIGNPFIEKEPLVVVYNEERDHVVKMDMHLRRRVQWGPAIFRRGLPYGLLISLKANQTVFNLDAKWEAIYHTLYPAFLSENKLYLSAKIKTKQDIKNHNIATIFKLLDEVEVIGKTMAEGASCEDFDQTIKEYIKKDALTITTKAQFHSAGDIWNAITSGTLDFDLNNWVIYTVIAYSMIFGNHKAGFDGLIDIDTRKKFWDLVLSRIKKNHAEKVVETLQIELPKIDTSKLEDCTNDRE